MNKIPLITLIALCCSPLTVQAQTAINTNNSFSYLSSGLQYTALQNEVISSAYSYDDGYEAKSTDSLAGIYLRGSWNFADNLFVELRYDVTLRDTLTLSHNMLGIGYYQPILDGLAFYGLAGGARTKLEHEILNNEQSGLVKVNQKDNGFTGELGARVAFTDAWSIEPALRVAHYDQTLREVRLGNIVQVSKQMSLELNTQQRSIGDYEETNYQMGARYTF